MIPVPDRTRNGETCSAGRCNAPQSEVLLEGIEVAEAIDSREPSRSPAIRVRSWSARHGNESDTEGD